MTQLVIFNDEHNEDVSLLSCDAPAFEEDASPVSQLEEALQKISDPCAFSDLPLHDDHFSWESEGKFSTSLSDFLLSDQIPKFDQETSLCPENRLLSITCETPATLKKPDHPNSLPDTSRQMDLSPRSVVDISNPSITPQRSPYCIIRSSHSATAAAAAATAAMIVNDDASVAAARSCSSILNLHYSGLPKRPRFSDGPESELLSSSSLKSAVDQCDMDHTHKSECESKLFSSTRKMALQKQQKGATDKSCLNALKLAKMGNSIQKKLPTFVGRTEFLTEEEQAIMERARQCRAEALVRFRKKKAVRSFGRRVRYECRKKIAVSRPRVNGRFAKKSDIEAKQNA